MLWRVHSIRTRLSLVFLFLFVLALTLGWEGLESLKSVNDAAAQVRDRWLPSTRALDDLSNFTSDLPPAADALSRASGPVESAALRLRVRAIEHGVMVAETAYAKIGHDANERRLFGQFTAAWTRYIDALDTPEAGAAYRASVEALTAITALNASGALQAGRSADLAYRRARQHILVTIGLTGILVAIAMIYVARSISGPLILLAGGMRKLAASELEPSAFGVERRDEIGEMARAVTVFRDNAVDLARSRHALALKTAELEDKLRAEKEVTMLQRNFVSMASHEFRTPLGIIDGNAQRILHLRDRLSLEDLVKRVQKIRKAVTRMTQLIDNLIGSARRIDGGHAQDFQPAAVDLLVLIREVCQLQRELTPDIPILEIIEPTPLVVDGDSALLHQLFGNLISNAAKYSHDRLPVVITAAPMDPWVTIMVRDRGLGIPEADRDRIFQRYYRGSNTAGIVGSGVGLYIVATIVDQHAGKIDVSSQEGVGSCFTVKLPAYKG